MTREDRLKSKSARMSCSLEQISVFAPVKNLDPVGVRILHNILTAFQKLCKIKPSSGDRECSSKGYLDKSNVLHLASIRLLDKFYAQIFKTLAGGIHIWHLKPGHGIAWLLHSSQHILQTLRSLNGALRNAAPNMAVSLGVAVAIVNEGVFVFLLGSPVEHQSDLL